MGFYDITLKDETTYYGIEANSEEEAKEKALGRWNRDYESHKPSVTVKENKKVKKTVYYSVINYYKQDVLVDEKLDNYKIKNLWNDGYIETLNEPELADDNFPDGDVDYDSIYVE